MTYVEALQKKKSQLRCAECGGEINEYIHTYWRRIEGWEKKREGGGTNHVALRKALNSVMCDGCMTKLLAGVDVNQQSLL